MVVVFPAPFSPTRPIIKPTGKVNETLSNLKSLNVFVKLQISKALVFII